MPVDRLSDERVAEIAESGDVFIDEHRELSLAETHGIGHENWPSEEAAALAREVLECRKWATPWPAGVPVRFSGAIPHGEVWVNPEWWAGIRLAQTGSDRLDKMIAWIRANNPPAQPEPEESR